MSQKRPPCGTDGGYTAHRRRGEDACLECKAAHATYHRKRTAIKAGRAPNPPRSHGFPAISSTIVPKLKEHHDHAFTRADIEAARGGL